MKKPLILVYNLLFFFTFQISSQVIQSKEKILVAEPESKINNPVNYKEKVKNLLLVKTLKMNPSRFTIFDSDYIKNILELKVQQQQLGCTEQECGLQLEKILQPDWKLISVISQNPDQKINVSLKLFKFSGESPSLFSFVEKSFEPHQLDFYIDELVNFLFTSGYKIRDEIAPIKIQALTDLNILNLRDIKLEVLEVKPGGDTDRVNNYIRDYNNLLKEGNLKYSENKYWDAYKIYSGIINTIRNDLTSDTRILIKDYEKFVFEKMEVSFFNSYSVEVKKLDQQFQEKINISPEEILNLYVKYDSVYQHFLNAKKSYPGNPNEVDDIISNRLDTLLIIKWSGDEKIGDTSYVSYDFSNSYSQYDKILQDIAKIKRKETEKRKVFREKLELKKLNAMKTGVGFARNKVSALTELMERKNSVYLSYFRSSLQDKTEAREADSIVKKISKELEIFLLSPEQNLFISSEIISINDKVAKEVNESRISIADPLRVIYIGNQDSFKRLVQNEKRKKEIKDLEKRTSNYSSTPGNNPVPTIPKKKPTRVTEKDLTYYLIHTLLFPIKYAINIIKSVTDIISITPVLGAGWGTEILFFNVGAGIALPPEDFTFTTVDPFEKDSVPGAPGDFIVEVGVIGYNTCENILFIRGLDSDCRAGKPAQYSTLNLWVAGLVGAHFTFDMGRILDIVPVILLLDQPSYVYDEKYRAKRIQYYPD